MERFRRQRSPAARLSSPSKVTTIIDRSSDDKLSSSDRHHRGNHQTVKQRFQKWETDYSSRGNCRTTSEHQLAVELGQSSSVLPAGKLMKSLLADEMSRETESRRRAPSVIAKLMGLDRLPSQHSINKQPKRFSDGFQGKTVSVGTCRHRKCCNNQSCRKIAREEHLFKDVYEVRESLKGQIEGYPSQVPPNKKHTEDEIAFIRQKFMDAKRLSTDERLQDSKEFHDAIDVLNSNNHLFLKFLQEPDSLFAKHVHDLHYSPQSLCGDIQNLKASKVLDYNINAIGRQPGREASQKIDISMSRHCQEGVRGHISHRNAQHSDKLVNFSAEGKEATSGAPTKIVLLKPNVGRSHKAAKSFSSSSPCELRSDVEMHTAKQMHDKRGEAELWGAKRLPIDLDFSAHNSQESRELAKEITQQMKGKIGEVSVNVPLSGYRGYSADESSHDMSGNDSSYESDTLFLTSQTPYSSSFRGKSSSLRFSESSVNKEGKKRLSERWKMTHRPEEIRADKGTTLGEMLCMPDLDIMSPNLDAAMPEDGSSGRFDSNVSLAGSVGPLGISSKDGWKDGCIRRLSRSRSLPITHGHVESSENCVKHEVLAMERFLVPKEGAGHGRKKAENRDLSWKEGSSSRSRRLSDKKPDSSLRMSKEMANNEHEFQVDGNEKKSDLEEKDSPELKTVILEAPTCRLDTILNLDLTMEMEHECIPMSLNSGDNLLPTAELSTDLQVKDKSSSSGLHEPTQNPATQPESPASSKEADQPSPVSVLEAPFSEDLSSSSECFERVSAELHGLRMQLQLLKLESKTYDEGSSMISSDDDEGSAGCAEVAKGPTVFTAVDTWEASYTVDVLAELGLEYNDFNVLINTWNSSECPVGPWVFEKLEKKYSDEGPNCSRPDRRLLFDRIKYGVMEITQRSINPHPWVKTGSSSKTRPPRWSKAWFETELCKLLAAELKREKSGMEEVVLSDGQWMDLGMHMDGIGREIGKMVLDELISESLTM